MQLPVSVIDAILEKVPLRHHMSSCGLVCSAWADAARRATAEITHPVSNTALQHLQHYLKQHGQHVSTLQRINISTNRFKESWFGMASVHGLFASLCLPCASLTQLQVLTLHSIDLQLDAGDSEPIQAPDDASNTHSSSAGKALPAAAAPAGGLLPSLKALELKDCLIQDPAQLLRLLPTASLTSLVLDSLVTPPPNKHDVFAMWVNEDDKPWHAEMQATIRSCRGCSS